MVQVEASFGYHEDVETKERPDSLVGLVRDAVRDFVTSIGESSKQLTAAAEKFATDTLTAVDEAARQAQTAADVSRDMATAAGQAADDTRKAIESLQATVSDAGREAVTAARQAAESAREAGQHALRAQQLSEPPVGASVQQVLERLETDYQLLARLVQDLHSRIATLSGSAPQIPMEAVAETPAPTAQELIADIAESRGPETAGPEVAAPTGRTTWYQSPAWVAGSEPVVSPEAAPAEVEIAAQAPTAPVAEPTGRTTGYQNPAWVAGSEPSTSSAVQETTVEGASAETPGTPAAEPTGRTTWYQNPPWLGASQEAGVPETTPAAYSTWPEEYRGELPVEPEAGGEARTAPSSLAGRVLVSISPVPDFDRLLSLDGALGRMSGVRNVTLADYAKEEVTFRIEVDDAITADDFAHGLAESAGLEVEIVSASEEKLALRLPN